MIKGYSEFGDYVQRMINVEVIVTSSLGGSTGDNENQGGTNDGIKVIMKMKVGENVNE